MLDSSYYYDKRLSEEIQYCAFLEWLWNFPAK